MVQKSYAACQSYTKKAMVILVIVYCLCIGLIGMVYGLPFAIQHPLSEGWIVKHILWFVICALVSFLIACFYVYRGIKSLVGKYDSILCKQLDRKNYMGQLDQGLEYGKNHNLSIAQKAFFLSLQERYVMALLLNGKVLEAQYYMNHMWCGHRNNRSYQRTFAYVSLAVAYKQQDLSSFYKNKEMYKRWIKSLHYLDFYQYALEGNLDACKQVVTKLKECKNHDHVYEKIIQEQLEHIKKAL